MPCLWHQKHDLQIGNVLGRWECQRLVFPKQLFADNKTEAELTQTDSQADKMEIDTCSGAEDEIKQNQLMQSPLTLRAAPRLYRLPETFQAGLLCESRSNAVLGDLRLWSRRGNTYLLQQQPTNFYLKLCKSTLVFDTAYCSRCLL